MDSSSSSHHQGSLGSTNPRKGNPALAANFRNQCGSNSPSPLKLSSPPKRPSAKKKTKPTDGSTHGQIPDGGEKWRVPQPGIGSVTCTLVDQLDAGKPFLLPTPSPNINPPTNCKSLQGQSGDTKVSHASHNGKEDGHIESGTSKITRNPKRR
uniref:Uncharacterized protein n=1 Tax=Ciona savignyi TaxID=51511 RepID=H2Z1J9_CIOSA